MKLEFRSGMDDAWYDVEIARNGYGCLRIKFCGFSDDQDEVLRADDLTSFRDIDDFRQRFRPVSVQVQDSECSAVVKGMLVCAALSICPDDRRFYDAVVNKVVHKEHQFVNGEEECSCSFILFWRHGPKAGSLTTELLESICRVHPCTNKMHPLLTSFLETAGEKIETTLSNICTTPSEAAYRAKTCIPNSTQKLSVSQHLKQDTRTSKRSPRLISDFKEGIDNSSQRVGHGMDKQEVPHMIIVENLEKGLSPLRIVEFMHQQVSISCQAFVSPSKSYECHTRGSILLDSRKNADKLCDFLESPDQIIISANGRPWVMTEKKPVDKTLMASVESYMLISQKILHNRIPVASNELKVVFSGTEEYKKAKLLKDLFWEFTNHQRALHRRLLLEEGKIWQLYDSV